MALHHSCVTFPTTTRWSDSGLHLPCLVGKCHAGVFGRLEAARMCTLLLSEPLILPHYDKVLGLDLWKTANDIK